MEKYVSIAFLLVGLSLAYVKIAERYNIIDKPNHRSSHTTPTIRGGGVLFLFGLWIFFVLSGFLYPYFVLGVTLISAVSFIDDIKPLSADIRLPFQFIAILFTLYQIDLFVLPWWSMLILPVLGVGFINIYNFMDGINGITGLYSLVVVSGLYFVNRETLVLNPDLFIILMLAIAVFGYFNFRKKARFFAGDIGSISLAVILFFIGGSLMYNLEAPVLILFVVVYGADAILTLVYRKYIGESITEAHRHHLYQKFVDVKKIPHLVVAAGYAIAQLCVNTLVWYTYKYPFEIQLFVFISVVSVLIVTYVLLFNWMKIKTENLES